MTDSQERLPSATVSLDDIAAQLISLTHANKPELEAIRLELQKLASGWPGNSEPNDNLLLTAAFIQQAISGSTDDPEASMAMASDSLDAAISAIAKMPAAPQAAPAASAPAEAPAGRPETASFEIPLESAPTPAPAAAPEPKPAAAPTPPQAQASEDSLPRLPLDADMDIMGDYIVESLDHINNAEAALLALEVSPDDSEQINLIFRAFHTIKGTSGFLALEHIQRLAHLAENLLDRARSNQVRITGGYADLALRSCDSLKSMIAALKGIQPGQTYAVPERLDELLTILTDPAAAGVTEEAPSESLRVGDILVARGQVERAAVEDLEQKTGLEDPRPIGERLVEADLAKGQDVASALRTQKQAGQIAGASDATVRVGTGRLDSLIDMVGELVIAQSMVSQDPAVSGGEKPRLTRNVGHAGKIIRELQDLTMSLRMVPLKATFQKMARLVRELSRKSGKAVQFVVEGEDTEIDRNMVEALNDPLIHMIRNSLDHGVEPADERIKAGKDKASTVRLSAYHSAGNVIIELSDDGRGLNREKILAKGIDRGLIDPQRDHSDAEVFNLIFHPGFSTADKITDVSGRGVGMDVVKRSVETLHGRVELTTRPGQGTTFTIRLPLTMAITDAMLLRVGKERYLLPTASIERSIRPEEGSISTVVGSGEMVLLRGELLPVFRLHRMFNVPDAVCDPYRGLLIVIEGDGKRCALMVDELLGQQQVVIKSLGQMFKETKGAAGAAILGDGRVGLILDATGLIQLAHGQAASAAA